MKNIFTLLLLLFSSLLFAQKNENLKKIDISYLMSKSLLDTNKLYIINDNVYMDFLYNKNPNNINNILDKRFELNLKRTIRIKINKFDKDELKNLRFYLYDEITKDIKIENLVLIMNYIKGGKLKKAKFKDLDLVLQKDSSSVFLDIGSMSIPNLSIIDINYTIVSIPKNRFEWKLHNNCFITKRQISINIPEIYNYNIIYELTNYKLKDYFIEKSKSILVGYGSDGLNGKIMSPSSYKRLYQQQGFIIPAVYCKKNTHRYYFENIMPVKNSLNTDWILLIQ